jgi:hypothetical protein
MLHRISKKSGAPLGDVTEFNFSTLIFSIRTSDMFYFKINGLGASSDRTPLIQ